jgi:type III secretion protein T
MELLLSLSREYDVYLIAIILTIPRIYAFLQSSTLLNSSVVPGMPRAAIVIVLALSICPINLAFATAFDRSITTLAVYFAKEFALGFLLGYLVSWVFWSIQAAGAFIDSQRGGAIAEAIDPLRGDQTSLLGNLFSQVFLAYIFTTGTFLLILGLLFKSYKVWPTQNLIPTISAKFPEQLLSLFDTAMELVVVLAAPIIALMFLVEFSLALLSRFAPQIQVFILAMPLKSLLAVIVLVFYFSTLLPQADRYLASTEVFMSWAYDSIDMNKNAGNQAPQ